MVTFICKSNLSSVKESVKESLFVKENYVFLLIIYSKYNLLVILWFKNCVVNKCYYSVFGH